ncbi:MAG: ABC transporter ATP-binding protein [Firmicutes bacterium]|jgi:oligopeptide/dipeptide ABC transporter ATP-binding protein|nr:ABC transporter ATP-binding protein [Bacillota bacterium]
MTQKLLSVRDLKTYFYTDDGVIPAVDGVSFDLDRGGTIGIVGESGCGKSVTSLSVMGLIPDPPGKIVGGEIIFEGQNLLELSEAEMRNIRGNDISMIFQEPMTSLNPVFTIGNQIMEAIILHQHLDKAAAREKAIEMLHLVGIPSPDKRIDEYPHQLSGGMRQRVMIAMALSCNPKLLIADEPTTALDVTIQAQILDLMRELREELGTAIMMITHDLGVIAELVDKVAVMYTGKIVESADTYTIFGDPLHPYTIGLLGSIPKLEGTVDRLQTIPGTVPTPGSFPVGCGFHPRCPFAKDICVAKEPPAFEVKPGHHVACWKMVDYVDTDVVDQKEVG